MESVLWWNSLKTHMPRCKVAGELVSQACVEMGMAVDRDWWSMTLSSPSLSLLFCNQKVVSNSLRPHGLWQARLPCPSPSPGVCSNSCPLSQWCHPIVSFCVVPSSSCPQSFPASEFFLVSWLFSSGGQSIGASVSASVLPMNIQGWFPLGLTGLISLLSRGLSRLFSITTVRKHQLFSAQPSLWSNSHIHTWLLEKS